MESFVAAVVTLIGQLAPLIAKAVSARTEDHAKILTDALDAVDGFAGTVAQMPAIIARDDAEADALAKGLKGEVP